MKEILSQQKNAQIAQRVQTEQDGNLADSKSSKQAADIPANGLKVGQPGVDKFLRTVL